METWHYWCLYTHCHGKPICVIISTDASSFGWGASLGQNKTGGQFSTEENQQHINILELKAS